MAADKSDERLGVLEVSLGRVVLKQGKAGVALRWLESGLKRLGEFRLDIQAGGICRKGEALFLQGKYQDSDQYFNEGIKLYLRIKDPRRAAFCKAIYAELLAFEKKWGEAERLLSEGEKVSRGCSDKDTLTYCLLIGTHVAMQTGKRQEAEERSKEALSLADELGAPGLKIRARCARAEILSEGDGRSSSEATRLVEEAWSIAEQYTTQGRVMVGVTVLKLLIEWDKQAVAEDLLPLLRSAIDHDEKEGVLHSPLVKADLDSLREELGEEENISDDAHGLKQAVQEAIRRLDDLSRNAVSPTLSLGHGTGQTG